MNQANIVLTGVPRSGTTLTCHLLNKLPDTVALHEPMAYGRIADPEDREGVLDGIEQFFERMRHTIRTEKVAYSKEMERQITDSAYDVSSETELRRRAIGNPRGPGKKGAVRIEKDLGDRFFLVIKHPAMFSALLPDLVKRFPCYATVRNPLSILASWNSINRHTRRGHAPAAELYDEKLRRALGAIEDRNERQLYLLSWFFQRYRSTLPDEHIIRYEKIVTSGGKALSVINADAKRLDELLPSRNLNPIYDRESMRSLGQRLLDSEGAYWDFYSRQSVEELLAEVL